MRKFTRSERDKGVGLCHANVQLARETKRSSWRVLKREVSFICNQLYAVS